MHIAHADAGILQIRRQILGHFLCQRRDEHALLALNDAVAFADEVVDLPVDGPDLDLRVQQARRTDDLLGDLPGAAALVFARRGGDVDGLMDLFLEFRERQWAVVERARQAEAVFHQTLLA